MKDRIQDDAMRRPIFRNLPMIFLLLCLAVLLAWLALGPRWPTVRGSLGLRPAPKTFSQRLAYAAEDIVDPGVVYDAAYVQIPYPNGDVPAKRGVCADVVIRAYRRVGIDLQARVHEDMQAHFSAYPRMWGLHRPDPNIDHRRVYNLAAFFKRHGATLPVTKHGADYQPGDIVVWRVQNQGHIGIVSSLCSRSRDRYLIVHNSGGGQVLQDMLFNYPIIGHYRYAGKSE